MIEFRPFGKLTDLNLQLPLLDFPMMFSELKFKLEDLNPRLKGITYLIILDGKQIENDEQILQKPTIIALLPPFSGG